MRVALLLLTFLTFSCSAYGSPEEPSVGHSVEPTSFGLTGRIVNGTKATFGQFPHQVSLKRSWSESHFCGGSIISVNLVLTAAHCMYRNGVIVQPWTIMVVGGQLKLNEFTPTAQKRGVEKIKIHPQFDMKNLVNDIAILELSAPFEFSSELHSAPLAASNIVPNTVCQVSGWGYPAQDIKVVSNDLMYVDLPIRDFKECRELLINVTDLPKGMYCAGYLEGKKDACQGDSGGGMVCNGILTGVVSGGEGCALPRFPGVYSNVYHYRKWISKGEYIELVRYGSSQDSYYNSSSRRAPTNIVAAISMFFTLLLIMSCS